MTSIFFCKLRAKINVYLITFGDFGAKFEYCGKSMRGIEKVFKKEARNATDQLFIIVKVAFHINGSKLDLLYLLKWYFIVFRVKALV